ncbi:hypothetical protein BN1723_011458, partial [Verticillium longisporum]
MPPSLRVLPNAAKRATNLLRTIQYTHPPSCPCHSNPNHHHHQKITPRPLRSSPSANSRSYAAPAGPLKEYAFEMAASAIRFGPGCTQEVGLDLKNMAAERVAVVTDATVDGLVAMQQVRESLDREGINYKVYNQCRVEPKDSSVKEAIAWARPYNPSAFLAVGGGSVIDTAKLMNLYTAYPDADFLDFVNAPLGRGLPVDKPLKPLIAVPTTAGTGSETTGTAIFDLVSKRAKTGVAHRNLKPTLGICDPLNTATMPAAVKASSGLDVLCHALESWTAIPYTERTPRPTNPINRPAYQGAGGRRPPPPQQHQGQPPSRPTTSDQQQGLGRPPPQNPGQPPSRPTTSDQQQGSSRPPMPEGVSSNVSGFSASSSTISTNAAAASNYSLQQTAVPPPARRSPYLQNGTNSPSGS